MSEELLADFFERPELAAALKRSERSLDRWADIGQGPPRVKLGSRVLYPKRAVMAWLAELKEPPAPKRRKR